MGSSNKCSELNWVVEIENEAKELDPCEEWIHWSKQTIYHVPDFAKKLKGTQSFEPRVVSLGPYHHGKDHLKELESHKRRALAHLVKRSGKSVGSFLDAMRTAVVELQECYHNLDNEWKEDRDGFLKLMLFDGSFMLEILRSPRVGEAHSAVYAENDPIFSKSMIQKLTYIRRDMLLLENQLPLLVLKTIMQVEKDCNTPIINKIVLGFLGYDVASFGGPPVPKKLGLHALCLSRACLLQRSNDQPPKKEQDRAERDEHMRSASKLHEAGIRFKKSSTTGLSDITFKGNVLRLPRIVIDDATECLFLNIMVFEHLHAGVGSEVSSYVAFMDLIIDNAEDVGLLLEAKIIQNMIGSDEAVAELFNGLGREITIDQASKLVIVKQRVNVYYEQRCHRNMASLRRKYLKDPWKTISLLVAGSLLILSLLQTIYTMYAYYHPPSSS